MMNVPKCGVIPPSKYVGCLEGGFVSDQLLTVREAKALTQLETF